jgi:Fe-S cluster assembly protein SufD
MSLITAAKQQLDLLTPAASREEKALREEAWRRMETLGLPHRRTETWKYSSLAVLDKMTWPVPAPTSLVLPPVLVRWLAARKAQFEIAVLVDGVFRPELSALGAEIKASPAAMQPFHGEDGFANMSLAVAKPGLRIEVAAGAKVRRPLLILKYQSHGGWLSSFHELALGDGAELRLAEVFAGGSARFLRTDLNLATVGENASLQWLRHQGEPGDCSHFSETQVKLARASRLHFTQVHRGSRWLRAQTFIDLNGEGAEAQLQGLTFGENEQHLDQRIVLNHRAGNTSSGQLFKGVLKDKAKGTTNGKIFIAQDAQKVASLQMNHNLLLSPGAEANTKPELEIYADDVKANHGATVGRLDEEKMFYLRSRGLTAAAAEKLLSEAFARDVYMKIPDLLLREIAEAGHGS